MNNLPPVYELTTSKKNLQGSKEQLTRIVPKDALRSRYSVQSDGKRGNEIQDAALFVSGSKAGRGIGRGGD